MNRVFIPDLATPPEPLAGGRIVSLAGETMGTSWSARVVAPAGAAGAFAPVIEAALDSVVAEMSHWRADSFITRFNRAAAGERFEAPAGFVAVLQAALDVAAETDGAFDPAMGALVDLWGFGPAGRGAAWRPPSGDDIAAMRCGGGWRGLRLDGREIEQPGGVQLDFSGVAKGFAVDKASAALTRAGSPAHLVEIGGELRGVGVKPDGAPWWVTLETPPGGSAGDPILVALCGFSVATSGDYLRFVETEAGRLAHTLDPRTGAPLAASPALVTVLHEDCMRADAYATALCVMGVEAGLAFATRRELAARFLTRRPGGFDERLSPSFERALG